MNIVVGIPTKNEHATIASVTEIVDRGLKVAFPFAHTYIVNADNGSTDGTAARFLETPTWARKIAVSTGAHGTGKGSNVFAILEKASEIGADAVCLIDGDLRSAQPSWVKTLLDAALVKSDATFVTPEYTRNRYEANSTNQLVRPYLRAAFGLDVRQPIGGEFAMNAALVEQALTWSRAESTNLYGIDVWLTANTALRGLDLTQVHIGRKLHNPTFPKIYKLGQQVLDALFRLMMEHRPATPRVASQSDRYVLQIDEMGARPPAKLVDPVTHRASAFIVPNWDELVFTFPALVGQRRPDHGALPFISTDMWCQILTDAYTQLDATNFRIVRDRLVGLFPARVTSYWQEIEGMTTHGVEALLDRQTEQVACMFAELALPTKSIDVSHDPSFQPGVWQEGDVPVG